MKKSEKMVQYDWATKFSAKILLPTENGICVHTLFDAATVRGASRCFVVLQVSLSRIKERKKPWFRSLCSDMVPPAPTNLPPPWVPRSRLLRGMSPLGGLLYAFPQEIVGRKHSGSD